METGILLVIGALVVAWMIGWVGYAVHGEGALSFGIGLFMAIGFPPLLLGLLLIVANV